MTERLLEVGDGVEVWTADLDEIHEQDTNARVMDSAAFDRLAENIKERGLLVESLPYCHIDGEQKLRIISGHHRVRAARAAGVRRLHLLVDTREMTRGQVVSKQLAHNAIAGKDDPSVLRQLIDELTNVDDLLRSFIAPDMLPEVKANTLVTPAVQIDYAFHAVLFAFLPSQMTDFKDLLDRVAGRQDLVGVAPVDCYDDFKDALAKFQKARDVRSVGTAIALLTRMALEDCERAGQADMVDEGSEEGSAAAA